ncbi:MAG: transposase [Thermoflexus sp.]
MQAQHSNGFEVEWLPAYAPDLNPVELVWDHTYYGSLVNFIPEHFGGRYTLTAPRRR